MNEMTFSTAFISEHPQSVIDELVKEQLLCNESNIASKIIEFFKQHFDNEHILNSIPTTHTTGLVKGTAMLQQNGMEPEYFYATTKNGCNPGYFKLGSDGILDEECAVAGGSGMAVKKTAKLIFINNANSIVRTCYYYDDLLDEAVLNSVHELVGFFENIDEGEDGLVFHILFAIPPANKCHATPLQWPAGCNQLLKFWSISRPSIRTPDGLAIGAMSLNLYNVKEDCDFDKIVNFAKTCFRRVAIIKVDGKSLSDKNMVPELDIESGLLKHTELQLPNPCCLILDERQMQCGQLNECATKNIRALISIATQQRISYTFPFQSSVDVDVDYPCLIVSQDKSLIPANWRLDYHLSNGVSGLDEDWKDSIESKRIDWKDLIESKRMGNTDIEQAVANLIEQDYVSINKTSKKKINEQELHSLLTLTRLVAIDAGRDKVNFEDWQTAVGLIM